MMGDWLLWICVLSMRVTYLHWEKNSVVTSRDDGSLLEEVGGRIERKIEKCGDRLNDVQV